MGNIRRKNRFRTNIVSLIRKKAAAEDRRLTQRIVAQEMGLGYATVSRWASGKISWIDVDTLARFQQYFGCTMEELIVDTQKDQLNAQGG